MAKFKQQPVPKVVEPALEEAGIKIKNYKSVTSFENDLKKFIKRNEVLHLSTCRKNAPRATPLGYFSEGLTVFVLSEGGAKFQNLKENKKVSFSIAEPYFVAKDFFGNKGLQAWGTAKVYSKKKNPGQFAEALKRMNIKNIVRGKRRLAPEDLPPFNYRIIEITPDRIKYGNPREGVYHITWDKKG